MHFTIELRPITKKNSQRIITCHNRPMILPSKAYVQYEKDCRPFMPQIEQITCPVNIKAVYHMPHNRRVDLTNLHEALHDVLVKYGVIADDNYKIVYSTDGSHVAVDKNRPRTEVTITKAGEMGEHT